jgi:hypothetical protein
MGLDVYFHHVARQFEGDPTDNKQFNQFCEQVDEDARSNFRKQLDKLLKPLRKAWEEAKTNDYWKGIYNERYFAFVEKLRPIIAKNYDWKIRPYTDKILTLPELEEQLNKEVEDHYESYDAYFRKVNFLFKYFEDRGKMVDQYYAFVEPEDVEDIIDKCEQVLKDKNQQNAHELLPTQDGFFFGSTDYDDWYFYDVKDCLKQMKQYLKLFKKPGTAYVIFSW